jgi:serine/arginine repetitive matrix protein 2
MRSVGLLARKGSWAQFSVAMEDGRGSKGSGMAKDKAKKKNDGTVGKKEGKDKKTRSKKTEDAEGGGDDAKKSKSKKSCKSKSNKPNDSTQTQAKEASPRFLTSSFEVGVFSASPGPMAARTLGESTSSTSSAGAGSGAYLGVRGVAWKKRSIVGLGLPSTIRLPTARSRSTTSSILVGGVHTVGPSFGASTSAATPAAAPFSVSGNTNNNSVANYNRLSVDSALNFNNPTTSARPSFVLSNASSAGSSPSYIHHIHGLAPDRRTSRESKHSLEGRKRGSLAS